MKLRNAGVLVAVLAALGGCKKKPEEVTAPTPVAPVTQAGSASAATAPAAEGDPWAKPSAAKDPLKKPLFWSIEKDGKTTYLLGTMHIGIDPTSRLPDVVWKKLDDAKTFAMETDISSAKGLDVLRKDGTTLEQELGDKYWAKLEDALGATDAARMRGFKPMIPATMLSLKGLPETAPMDGVLHGRALNQKKKIVFLEPMELQAKMLEKWMTARALKEMLDDVPGLEKRGKDMLAAYIAGDEAKVLAITEEERADFKKHGHTEAEYEEQMSDMLYKRNASWIDPIEKLHADGGGFIAVGAMHLIGPKSVLELLQNKGYKVTRITP